VGTLVSMAGTRFSPAIIAIRVGSTLRWSNDDSVAHTVTAADRSWDSGNVPVGGSFVRRFDAAGTYSYVCRYHASMKASVVVTAP
jgi:plastocyanin